MSGLRVVSIASLLCERAHDEAHYGFLRHGLVHVLGMRVPMPVDRPKHDRLVEEPRGDGRVGNRPEELPPTPLFEVLTEQPHQPATRPLDPQGGYLRVI